MRTVLSNVLVPLTFLVGALGDSGVRVDPESQSFKDKDGRTLLFHGINVVGKNSRQEQKLSEKQMDVMRDLGFNVVRLGLSWDLYETKPGVFDETYLDFVEAQVLALGARGMLSFIDMHQDLMAVQYCGHGLPEWHMWPENATSEFYKNGKFAFPRPVTSPEYGPDDAYSGKFGRISNCDKAQQGKLGWAGVYMTRALSNAAQQLYDNVAGRLDAFAVFWQRVARRFKNNPHILGYELINEPWIGDFFANPKLAIPSHADVVNMQPFYDKLHAAIREVDNETIVLFEPATGGNVQDATHYGADLSPGGSTYQQKTALSYHVYCPWVASDVPGTSISSFKEKLCEEFNGWQFGVRQADTQRLKVAGILSEFGDVNVSDPLAQQLLDFSMDKMDEQRHSWTYWYMHPQEDGKNIEAPLLARTFARAVAGEVQRMHFHRPTGNYSLEYLADPAIVHPTEVYVSTQHSYPSGLTYSLDPPSAGQVRQEGDLLFIHHAPQLQAKTLIKLTVTRLAGRSFELVSV
mmetsp:Transcript_63829/g.118646  ORF Transcript_63829/g.118646 Transcript_63829/m.118646 type:complete len:519 (-) Transcript_63829:84-1640(-)